MSADLEQLIRAAIAANAAWRIMMDRGVGFDSQSRAIWLRAEADLENLLEQPQ